jgi:hypothetical protein
MRGSSNKDQISASHSFVDCWRCCEEPHAFTVPATNDTPKQTQYQIREKPKTSTPLLASQGPNSFVRLGLAGFLQTPKQWHAFKVAALFFTVRPATLLLQNFNLSVRSSLLSFLSCLLTSLSYSSGLAHFAALACPSTPLPLRCSFLTLPC